MGAAQFARLPSPLNIDGAATARGYRAGDVAYLASEQSVVVFLVDGHAAVPADELVLLGRMTDGLEYLAGCHRSCAVDLVAASGSGARDDRAD